MKPIEVGCQAIVVGESLEFIGKSVKVIAKLIEDEAAIVGVPVKNGGPTIRQAAMVLWIVQGDNFFGNPALEKEFFVENMIGVRGNWAFETKDLMRIDGFDEEIKLEQEKDLYV